MKSAIAEYFQDTSVTSDGTGILCSHRAVHVVTLAVVIAFAPLLLLGGKCLGMPPVETEAELHTAMATYRIRQFEVALVVDPQMQSPTKLTIWYLEQEVFGNESQILWCHLIYGNSQPNWPGRICSYRICQLLDGRVAVGIATPSELRILEVNPRLGFAVAKFHVDVEELIKEQEGTYDKWLQLIHKYTPPIDSHDVRPQSLYGWPEEESVSPLDCIQFESILAFSGLLDSGKRWMIKVQRTDGSSFEMVKGENDEQWWISSYRFTKSNVSPAQARRRSVFLWSSIGITATVFLLAVYVIWNRRRKSIPTAGQ